MSFPQEVLSLLKRGSGAMTNSEIREGLGLEHDNPSTTKVSSALSALRKTGAIEQTTNPDGKPAYVPVAGYKPKPRSGGIPSAKGHTRAARKAKKVVGVTRGRPRKDAASSKPKRKYTRRAPAAVESSTPARGRTAAATVTLPSDQVRRLCVLALNPVESLDATDRQLIANCLLQAM